MSGTPLEGRCSPFRGSTVPAHAVLNITDRQLIVGSRAATQHRPQTAVQSLTVGGYGAPTRPDGQGQLVPAQAPAPLRGSYRGAISRQQNGTRGGMHRGQGLGFDGTLNGSPRNLAIRSQDPAMASGPQGGGGQTNGTANRGRGNVAPQKFTRGGYTKIDLTGSDEGVVRNNPDFQPQSYANVPPPANLDTRGRTRARGGFRGGTARGDGYRGRGTSRGRGAQAMTPS